MQSAYAPLAVFLLLVTCAGLWYAARAVRRGRSAPRWAEGLDRRRGLVMVLLGGAVLSLVGLGVLAIVSVVVGSG
jgi:hypothetical protein